MVPSLQNSGILFIKPSLISLILFNCLSYQQYDLLHREIISVQRNSSSKRPNSQFLCFVCLAQQVRRKKFVVGLALKSLVQCRFCKDSHTIFIAGRIQSYKSGLDNAKYGVSVSNSSSSKLVVSPNFSRKFIIQLSSSQFGLFHEKNTKIIRSLYSISDLTSSTSSS